MTQRKKAPPAEQQTPAVTTAAGISPAAASPASAGPAPDGDPAKIAQIEADLAQTRNAISGDLRTLGERLSPEHLKEEAREVLAEAKNTAVETLHEAKDVATSAFKEAKDNAMDTVSEKVEELRDNVRRAERETLGFLRENAVPLTLIGVGVAWFLSKRRTREERWNGQYRPGSYQHWEEDTWSYGSSASPSRLASSARDGISNAADRVRDAGSQAKERAGRWVEDAEHGVRNAADRARGFAERELEEVRQTARDVQHRVGGAATKARDVAGREAREVQEFSRQAAEQHPLAVGAIAVAAGLGVGLLLPSTRREDELLGPPRQRLLSEAKEAAQDWTQTARDTARSVTQTISGGA